jgi:hypothetical protein
VTNTFIRGRKVETIKQKHLMRKFNFASLAFAFIISSVLSTSCTDLIDPGAPLPNDSSVSLEARQGIINQDASINAGSKFAVKLRSSGVDSLLRVLNSSGNWNEHPFRTHQDKRNNGIVKSDFAFWKR